MKAKLYLLIFIVSLCSVQTSYAQQLQNPSFDSVYYGGIDRIWHWITSDAATFGGSSNDTILPQQVNTLFGLGQGHEVFGNIDIYNSSPYSTLALKLNTTNFKKNNGQAFDTYVVNGDHYYTDSTGYIDFTKCGVPFPYRPDSLKGFYQYIDSNLATTDYGLCIILLTKYNTSLGKRDTIAYNMDSLSFESSPWRTFSIPIDYVSSSQPDTLTVIFKASTNPFEGASFWLDNLEFVYGPNAISSMENNAKLPTIYPNPSSGTIYIKKNNWSITSYQILTMEGKVLEQSPYKEKIRLPQQTPKHCFLILYNNQQKVQTFKVSTY